MPLPSDEETVVGRYVPNRAADDEIASSLGMRNLMGDVGPRAVRAVRQGAPRGGGRRGGTYRRSIVFGVVHEADGWHVRVGSTDWAWHLIEFGSVNNPTYAPLRRGVERAGIRRVRTTPKGSG